MDMVPLNNGVNMPMLGLGTYALRGGDCERCVLEALELGYRLFDTAQMYGNEREVGNALRRGGVPRGELFVTTKLYRPSASYARAKQGIEASLNALQLDFIDLLLIHEPYREAEEMYPALEEAYRAGRLKAIGVSNFNASRCEAFLRACTVIPAVNQVEAHIFFQQRGLLEEMKKHGTHMQAWSPFAAGKNDFFSNPVLRALGLAHNKTPAQIALKYLVQLGISVIPKSSHRERMRENLGIFDFQLPDEDMQRIRALDGGKPCSAGTERTEDIPRPPHQAIRRPHAPTRFPQISGRSGAFHRSCRARVPAPASG